MQQLQRSELGRRHRRARGDDGADNPRRRRAAGRRWSGASIGCSPRPTHAGRPTPTVPRRPVRARRPAAGRPGRSSGEAPNFCKIARLDLLQLRGRGSHAGVSPRRVRAAVHIAVAPPSTSGSVARRLRRMRDRRRAPPPHRALGVAAERDAPRGAFVQRLRVVLAGARRNVLQPPGLDEAGMDRVAADAVPRARSAAPPSSARRRTSPLRRCCRRRGCGRRRSPKPTNMLRIAPPAFDYLHAVAAAEDVPSTLTR